MKLRYWKLFVPLLFHDTESEVGDYGSVDSRIYIHDRPARKERVENSVSCKRNPSGFQFSVCVYVCSWLDNNRTRDTAVPWQWPTMKEVFRSGTFCSRKWTGRPFKVLSHSRTKYLDQRRRSFSYTIYVPRTIDIFAILNAVNELLPKLPQQRNEINLTNIVESFQIFVESNGIFPNFLK